MRYQAKVTVEFDYVKEVEGKSWEEAVRTLDAWEKVPPNSELIRGHIVMLNDECRSCIYDDCVRGAARDEVLRDNFWEKASGEWRDMFHEEQKLAKRRYLWATPVALCLIAIGIAIGLCV